MEIMENIKKEESIKKWVLLVLTTILGFIFELALFSVIIIFILTVIGFY